VIPLQLRGMMITSNEQGMAGIARCLMPGYTKQRADRFGIVLSPTPFKGGSRNALIRNRREFDGVGLVPLYQYGVHDDELFLARTIGAVGRFTVMTSRRGSSPMQEQLTVKRRRGF
jgi:hypothetical protein